jgi:hypothetical protein
MTLQIEQQLQNAQASLDAAVATARIASNVPCVAAEPSQADHDPEDLAAAFFAKQAKKEEMNDIAQWANLIVKLEKINYSSGMDS